MRANRELFLVLTAASWMTACGGDKAADTSDTATGTTTGTTTGATTTAGTTTAGTTTGGTTTGSTATTGFARLVHLIGDAGPVDIYLGAATTPLTTDFPVGANSDGTGYDYIGFPPASYTVHLDDAMGSRVISYDTDVALGEYQTVLFVGSALMAQYYPGSELEPAGIKIVDDVAPEATGMHRLTVFHTAPGSFASDVWVSGGTAPDHTALDYMGWTTQVLPAGQTDLSIDVDWMGAGVDGVPDFTWPLTLSDGGWSYVYLMSDGIGGFGTALHHQRGMDNLPVMPNP